MATFRDLLRAAKATVNSISTEAAAERIASGAESGQINLGDLGRRARRLLEATAKPQDDEKLF